MCIINILMTMPWWYILITIVFCLYFTIRGIMEQMFIHAKGPYDKVERVIIVYIQEFLFKVIFTISAFVALFIANHILSSLKSVNDISAGTAVFLIFLIFWGITGVSGYLTFLVVSGRLPGMK